MKLNDLLYELEVDSSWLIDIDYDEPRAGVIMTTQHNQYSYFIKKVPVNVFNSWLKSTSKGTYFHNYIKGNYDIVRIVSK